MKINSKHIFNHINSFSFFFLLFLHKRCLVFFYWPCFLPLFSLLEVHIVCRMVDVKIHIVRIFRNVEKIDLLDLFMVSWSLCNYAIPGQFILAIVFFCVIISGWLWRDRLVLYTTIVLWARSGHAFLWSNVRQAVLFPYGFECRYSGIVYETICVVGRVFACFIVLIPWKKDLHWLKWSSWSLLLQRFRQFDYHLIDQGLLPQGSEMMFLLFFLDIMMLQDRQVWRILLMVIHLHDCNFLLKVQGDQSVVVFFLPECMRVYDLLHNDDIFSWVELFHRLSSGQYPHWRIRVRSKVLRYFYIWRILLNHSVFVLSRKRVGCISVTRFLFWLFGYAHSCWARIPNTGWDSCVGFWSSICEKTFVSLMIFGLCKVWMTWSSWSCVIWWFALSGFSCYMSWS